ncbi:MAG: DUF4129 domain-containing protein [Spirochaetales bacterium]|nr:DUF4129 domain-containing protein [Spirochaetales bacterium]
MSDVRSLYRLYIHPLLSITVPYLFIVTLVLVFKDAFLYDGPPPYVLFVFLLLVGIEETAIGNALVQERASSVARLRELILIVIGCLIVVSFMSGGRDSALWGGRVFIYVLLSVLQWSLSFTLQNNFRRREVFLGIIRRKEGEPLKEALRNAGAFTREINVNLSFNRSICTMFIAGDFFLLFMVHLMRMSLHWYTVVAAALSVCLCIAGIASVNMFMNDLFIYSAGINIRPYFQQRRIVASLVWLVFIAAAAALVSSEVSLLPGDIFTRFFDWLTGLFPKPRRIDPRLLPPPSMNGPDLQRQFQELNNLGGAGSDLAWLFMLIERIILVSLLLALAFFLIAPLLRGEGRSFFRTYNPVRVFVHVFGRMAAFLKHLLTQILLGFKRPAEMVDKKKTRTDKYGFVIPGNRAGVIKRFERSRVIRLYIKLTVWGRRKGLPWRSDGPQEYTLRLSKAFPGLAEELDVVSSIFEEVVFSSHSVGEKNIGRYRDAVRHILKT